MKNKKYIFLSIILLSFNLYAGVNGYGETVPDYQDGNTKMFDIIEEDSSGNLVTSSDINSSDNKNLVADDSLPREDIESGLTDQHNYGPESEGTAVIDSHGNRVYVKRLSAGGNQMLLNNPMDPSSVDLFNEENIVDQNDSSFSTMNNTSDYVKSDRYKNYQQQYNEYFRENNMTIKAAREGELYNKQTTENTFNGNTLNEYRSRFFDKVNIGGEASKTTRNFRTERKFGNTELEEADENATNLYSTLYSSSPQIADKQNTLNTNYGALTKALSSSDEIAQELESRLNSAKIECQITRNLIPSYKCPIPGLDGIMYPGNPDLGEIRKVNTQDAKKECNDLCWTPTTGPNSLSCVRQEVLTDLDTGISINNQVLLYPNWDITNTEKTFQTTSIMPVDYIDFDFTLEKPSNMTQEEFESFLMKARFKVNVSVLIRDSSEVAFADDMPPFTITDRETIDLLSPQIHISIPIGRTTSEIIVKVWEPFITPNRLEAWKYEHYFEELTDNGGSIKWTGLNAEYRSDSYYFCQALQMVDSPSLCIGGETILFEAVAGQMYYLCSAEEKRIGPEPLWGAFYDEDSCKSACTVHKDCKPTYRHYTSYGDDDYLLKAEVTCVDNPSNINCTQAACTSFFEDSDIRPNAEIIVHNDDTYVYTIRNKVLTGVPRPKIDLSAELAGNVDYQEMFDNEEKDSAYLAMLENMSFNRIKYKVGTESPWNMSYKKDSFDNGYSNNLSIILKPDSFDFDNGTTYYLYSVIRVLHSYSPIAGSWYLDSHMVTADPNNANIQWEDYTYIIKNSETDQDWSVFRRDQFARYLSIRTEMYIDDNGDLREKTNLDWLNTDSFSTSQYGQYNETADIFPALDPNSLAPYFKSMEFSSAQNYFQFPITSNIEQLIYETPGILIKDQVPINHETSFQKIYNVAPTTHRKVSSSKDYVLYFIYSDTRLTYAELMEAFEGPDNRYPSNKEEPVNIKNAAYQLLNEQLFRKDRIIYDGELNNNINVIKKGSPDKSSIGVEWGPSMTEKGKKVFKFIFLYDDQLPNPFEITNDN
jgi:hypothetical protein